MPANLLTCVCVPAAATIATVCLQFFIKQAVERPNTEVGLELRSPLATCAALRSGYS